MRLIAVACLLLLLACQCLAAPPTAYTLPGGKYLVVDELYVSIVDSDAKCPLLCCYAVTRESQAGSGEARNFKTLLPEASLERADYAGSGYDIGHLAPLGSFDGAAEFDDVNYLENCAPQRPDLNRGPWLKLEERERQLATEFGSVSVSCGTLFERPQPGLVNADEPHRVPSAFWKIVSWSGGQEAYRFEQSCSRTDALESFSVPVDSLR